MLSDLACGCDVYLVTGYTDMRKGIDGLATIVQGMRIFKESVKIVEICLPPTAVLLSYCGFFRRTDKGPG